MILEPIRERRSIRSYLPKPIEEEKLNRILEAGRLAPTAKNIQDWKIVVVDDPDLKIRLVDACAPLQPFIKEAAIILAACGTNTSYVMRCGQPAYVIDLAIVLDHISLQAQSEGLGTCWIGAFYEDKAKEVLGIPKEVRIVELMCVGYPAERPSARPRKPLDQIVCRNGWK